jgi:hypothetical protein
MVVSRCPECGATIGGQNHVLNASNRQDTQMEALAAAEGLGPSPFRWGAGV